MQSGKKCHQTRISEHNPGDCYVLQAVTCIREGLADNLPVAKSSLKLKKQSALIQSGRTAFCQVLSIGQKITMAACPFIRRHRYV
jgi:hypothetical protein